MGPRQIKQHCKLCDESQELIHVAMTELNLSRRRDCEQDSTALPKFANGNLDVAHFAKTGADTVQHPAPRDDFFDDFS
jgi:hypothetical protein